MGNPASNHSGEKCGKLNTKGEPCQKPAGWGRAEQEGPCKFHYDGEHSGDSDGSESGTVVSAQLVTETDEEAGGMPDPEDSRAGLDLKPKHRPYGRLQIERILNALEMGATYEIAARQGNISPPTFRRWRQQFPEVREAVKRVESQAAKDALDTIQNEAQAGNWKAASWLLERRFGFGRDEIPAEEVRQFADTVQDVIREELEDQEASELIQKIGAALDEVTDA